MIHDPNCPHCEDGWIDVTDKTYGHEFGFDDGEDGLIMECDCCSLKERWIRAQAKSVGLNLSEHPGLRLTLEASWEALVELQFDGTVKEHQIVSFVEKYERGEQ